MAQGTLPFAILAAALPVNASERDTLAAQAKACFDYHELAARAAAAQR